MVKLLDLAEESQQKVRDCSRCLDGEDEYGNSVPESLDIGSDKVSTKALAELAMAAVRITKRHRDFLGNMAGLEEAARRVLKSACVEGNLVVLHPDPRRYWTPSFRYLYRRVCLRGTKASEQRGKGAGTKPPAAPQRPTSV